MQHKFFRLSRTRLPGANVRIFWKERSEICGDDGGASMAIITLMKGVGYSLAAVHRLKNAVSNTP